MNPVICVVAVVAVVLCSVVVVAEVDNWAYRSFYGVVLPAIAVFDWLRLRAQGGDVRMAVDRLFVSTALAIGGLAMLAAIGE